MYNDSQLNITTHVPLSDQGGRGLTSSLSSNPPTISEPPVVKTKRFRRGDANPSDGRLFWCYEGEKRVDGSENIRERWVTADKYAELVERKRESDKAHTKSEAYRARAGKRAEAAKRWSKSERGRERAKIYRQKPEYKERRRDYEAKRYQRPEVAEKSRTAARNRYQRLKQDAAWAAKLRERTSKWREENKERLKELQRRWREQNPGWANDYTKRRYAEDPQFALAYKVRARVYQAIQKGGASKTGRTEELIGCSFDFLRQHIERQFKGKMSWDNPGSFHIDHIVPLAAFDLTDPAQLKVACNWQNMRPLSPRKNMSKGAKLLHPQQQLPLSVHSTTFNTQAA
jgi:hypothetical protein